VTLAAERDAIFARVGTEHGQTGKHLLVARLRSTHDEPAGGRSMKITRLRRLALAAAFSALGACEQEPSIDSAAAPKTLLSSLIGRSWSVCGLDYEAGTPTHLSFNDIFRIEEVVPGNPNELRLVPLSGTWDPGWWHLRLTAVGDPNNAFQLNPTYWPRSCTSSGQANGTEKDKPGDESNTLRFVGTTCLPNMPKKAGAPCPSDSQEHKVFVFLRPASNGVGGDHLYLEHCAPWEERNGRCALHDKWPHPGHVHSEPW
jgi:hypothetical protein